MQISLYFIRYFAI